MGWDSIREQTYERQLEMGIIPQGTKLTARPDWVPAWDSLDDQQKRSTADSWRISPASSPSRTHEIGRLIDAVHELPDGDNTLIFYIVGDNGASSEGGFDGTINEIKNLSGFPTDLEESRRISTSSAARTPSHTIRSAGPGPATRRSSGSSRWPRISAAPATRMVVTWPAKITDTAASARQFTHLIDVVPTILEAAQIPAPERSTASSRSRWTACRSCQLHRSGGAGDAQPAVFRGLQQPGDLRRRLDGGAQHTLPWRQDLAPGNWDKDRWELYNLDEDFSEAKDLAAEMPDKVAAMKRLFDEEAEKNHVYPLDDRGTGRLVSPKPTPSDPNRKNFVFYPGAVRLPETTAPNTKNKSHSISARDRAARERRRRRDHGGRRHLGRGKSEVRMDFAYDGAAGETGMGGTATLFINDEAVGSVQIDKTVAARFGLDTFGVGEDTGAPVSNAYQPPFPFTGTIDKVEIDLR